MVRSTFPNATVIANDANIGFGRANNQALQEARGDYALLLNPDAQLEEHALERLVAVLEQRAASGHRRTTSSRC